MELRHLRYLVAVADAGTVLGAAQHLRVAQQSLSAQVADAERELGVALFVRHPRGMALTKAGEEFVTYARRTLAEHAGAVAHVRRLGTDRPVLRVGVVEYGRGQRLVLAALAAFRADRPGVAVEVEPAAFGRQPALVQGGALDVAFYSGTLPEAARGLTADRVLADPIVGALLAAADPRAATAAIDPATDLRGEVLLLTAGQPAATAPVVVAFEAAGWRGRLREASEHPAVINGLVAAGAGVAPVPASLAGHTVPGTVYRPLAAGGGTAWDLHVLTRADAAGGGDPLGADPLAAAFLACLRAARDELTVETPSA